MDLDRPDAARYTRTVSKCFGMVTVLSGYTFCTSAMKVFVFSHCPSIGHLLIHFNYFTCCTIVRNQVEASMARKLKIGTIAKVAGVNVETIRYYQRRGLLSEPEKPHRGYRLYPADIVKHIRYIKRAQSLGFSLNEVAILLELDEPRICSTTRMMALDKIKAIDDKLEGLTSMRTALAALIQQSGTGRSRK